MIGDRARGLRRSANRLLQRFAPDVTILLYHRVTTLESDPQLLAVTPERFDEQLDLLRREHYPLSLRDLVKRLRTGKLPRRGVVLTFDDGYADNLLFAKPLLEKHDIPATVFVTSGCVGGQREFYWDELDRLILQPRALPAACRIAIRDRRYEWDLSAESHAEAQQDRPGWNLLSETVPSVRQRMYRELCEALRPLPFAEQERALTEVRKWADATACGRASHRPLTPAQLCALAAGDLIEIGAHTIDHPMLSSLPLDAQRRQIAGSKASLEYVLCKPVESFSYPYGGKPHYSPQTPNLVREAGFSSACSNFAGPVNKDSNLFELPRCLVRDWEADRLAVEIRELAA